MPQKTAEIVEKDLSDSLTPIEKLNALSFNAKLVLSNFFNPIALQL